jgi:hypothetical protein
MLKDGEIGIRMQDPDYVEPVLENKRLVSIKYGWEIEQEEVTTGNPRVDRQLARRERELNKLARVKEHGPGWIEHSLWVIKEGKLDRTESFKVLDEELWRKANNKQDGQFKFKIEEVDGKEYETDVVVEHTGIDEPLMLHWPNYKLLRWFGQSDNAMIESLQNALNSRETQLNDVLDKHSDPAMFGPAGFLDEYGRLYMSGGGGRYFPREPGEEPPGYLTWDAHVADVHAEIKRLYKAICDNSETSPALTGMEEGGVESGRALMYRLIRSLAMKARKGVYLERFLKRLFTLLQKVRIVWLEGGGTDVGEEPRTDWGDELLPVTVTLKNALPTDLREIVENVTMMHRDGVLSHRTLVEILSKYLEEVDPDEEMGRIGGEVDESQQREARNMGIPGAGMGSVGVEEEEEEE